MLRVGEGKGGGGSRGRCDPAFSLPSFSPAARRPVDQPLKSVALIPLSLLPHSLPVTTIPLPPLFSSFDFRFHHLVIPLLARLSLSDLLSLPSLLSSRIDTTDTPSLPSSPFSFFVLNRRGQLRR